MQTAATSLYAWVIILPVILPLAGAALLLMLGGRMRYVAAAAIVVVLAVGVCEVALLRQVLADGPLSMTMGRWLPPFGVSFTVDTMSAGFALTAAFVTLIILIYMQADAPESGVRSAFHTLVLLLLAGVNGAFLTGDLFNLYVWFEVMLIASFGLLVTSGAAPALDGTIKYGIINFIGTSLFLLALGLLYGALGTLNMADIVGAATKASPPVMTSIAALLLLAFGVKSAAFPVNSWLPASYHTPPPVVSTLLGGLLTKVGVYALLRMLVMLLPASGDLLHPVVALVAGTTLLLAPLGALAETNLRRAIGYLLIGGIGAAIAGIALPSLLGVSGAVAYVVNSMLTISALYLVAGQIERATGQADISQMGGLYTTNTLLAITFMLLVVTIAGVPPFLGFWPKLLLLQAAVERFGAGADRIMDGAALPLAICLLVNAFLTLIVGARLWAHIFWRDPPEGFTVGESPVPKGQQMFGFAAITALVAVITVGALWPAPLLEFGRAAAAGLLDPTRYIAAVGLAGGR